MTLVDLIFLVHVAATLMLTGIVWFIQVDHYPLLRYIDRPSFIRYEAAHTRLAMSLGVGLLVVESVTGGLLLWRRPAGVTIGQALSGLVLLGMVWGSTLCLQIPQHRILAGGFDETAYRKLVMSNWVRTLSYTARMCVILWMVRCAR